MDPITVQRDMNNGNVVIIIQAVCMASMHSEIWHMQNKIVGTTGELISQLPKVPLLFSTYPHVPHTSVPIGLSIQQLRLEKALVYCELFTTESPPNSHTDDL
jgi:hypothetical protein